MISGKLAGAKLAGGSRFAPAGIRLVAVGLASECVLQDVWLTLFRHICLRFGFVGVWFLGL